jgi:RNA polymerase sigma-70 factor (ECF subfamily)
LIVLRFYQELKLEEIAGVLDIPLGTVKSRLYQCLSELHRLLADRYGEDAGQSGGMNRQARTKGKGGYA